MRDFDRDELICDIWDRHSDLDGLMDIMAARKFAIDLLESIADLQNEAIRQQEKL